MTFSALLAAVLLAAAPRPVVLKAARMFDGRSDKLISPGLVVVDGERIAAAGAGARIPEGAEVVDLGDATLLPGLIDSHTHLFLQGEEPGEGSYDNQLLKASLALRAARATAAARRALEQGFTTIRDVETEGAGYGDVGIKQAVERGYVPGPRIFASTRAISTTGGYQLEGYAPEVPVPAGAQLIDGPVEARKAAREQLGHGADWIKVYMTHRSWVDKQGNLVSQPTLTLEELKAITDEAHGWRKKVACHAYSGVGLRRALDGGCDSIEHGLDLDDAAVAQMVKQGTWLCPTLAVYFKDWAKAGTPDGERDRKRAALHGPSFQRALKAGVRIAFGTDIGGISWSEPIAQEFAEMAKLGMSPAAALRSATSAAAEMLDMQGELGVLAPGAFADVVAVRGDPLRDLGELSRVQFVMKGGSVFRNDLRSANELSPARQEGPRATALPKAP